MILFGRKIKMCHKYIFKILTIQFVGMSRNSEYDKKYGTLRNVLLYTVHIIVICTWPCQCHILLSFSSWFSICYFSVNSCQNCLKLETQSYWYVTLVLPIVQVPNISIYKWCFILAEWTTRVPPKYIFRQFWQELTG